MMKRSAFVIVSLLSVLSSSSSCLAGQDVAAKLQAVSCTIHADNAQGSGVFVRRGDTVFALTAGHVVDGLRTVRDTVDSKTGATRKLVEFRDAKVVSELIEDGRSVGKIELDAEVIRYSNSDTGHDLALLRVRKKNAVAESAKFYLDEKIPSVGSDLFHCGSLLGQVGSNSITRGVISQHGRLINGFVLDQCDSTARPGSSGGGLFLRDDGRYVGMLVRGANEGDGMNFFVPIRRMREWASKVGVDFVLDESLPVPDDAKLKEQAVDDDGAK